MSENPQAPEDLDDEQVVQGQAAEDQHVEVGAQVYHEPDEQEA